MLSNAAFNAFLKTLEEPPAHAIFILATTEKHKIIPTILSRCQIYDFNRITVADTVGYLQMVAEKEGVTVDVNGLNVVAQKSDGGMRDALSIFDQLVSFCGNNITYQGVIDNLNVLDYEYYFKLVDGILKNEVSQSLLIFNEILNKGFDGHHFISGLSSHLRDVLVSKDPLTISLLEVGAGIGERYQKQAQLCPIDFLFKALRICNDCDIDYRQSKNKRLLVELALIRLCQLTDEKKKSIIDDEEHIPIQSIAVGNTESPPTSSTTTVSQPITAVHKPAASTPVYTPRPGSISISAPAMVSEPLASYVSKVEEQPKLTNKAFSIDELEKAWKQFANTIPEQGRITSFILSNAPQLISETDFEITVSNSLQQKEIARLQPDILSFLHVQLQNNSIKMTLKIMEETEIQRASTPEDRYKLLMDQNSALKTLRDGLNLEID
jgi:DNA polymerase-3 subunit gamma/tau